MACPLKNSSSSYGITNNLLIGTLLWCHPLYSPFQSLSSFAEVITYSEGGEDVFLLQHVRFEDDGVVGLYTWRPCVTHSA